jgi:hypothetical protein
LDHADRALALAVRQLDTGLLRVGWDRYAREKVTLQGLDVRLDFIAKSGKRRRMRVGTPAVRARLGRPQAPTGLPG